MVHHSLGPLNLNLINLSQQCCNTTATSSTEKLHSLLMAPCKLCSDLMAYRRQHHKFWKGPFSKMLTRNAIQAWSNQLQQWQFQMVCEMFSLSIFVYHNRIFEKVGGAGRKLHQHLQVVVTQDTIKMAKRGIGPVRKGSWQPKTFETENHTSV